MENLIDVAKAEILEEQRNAKIRAIKTQLKHVASITQELAATAKRLEEAERKVEEINDRPVDDFCGDMSPF